MHLFSVPPDSIADAFPEGPVEAVLGVVPFPIGPTAARAGRLCLRPLVVDMSGTPIAIRSSLKAILIPGGGNLHRGLAGLFFIA
jgi:hypothetical protein